MEDKRLMDNKVVKNPLLTGVNQTSFIQDFVQTSLIVPAAPPSLLQKTGDATNIGNEQNVEKEALGGVNKSVTTAVLPTLSTSASVNALGRPPEENQQIIQPILLPPNQISSSVNSQSLSDIPLDGSVSPISTLRQSPSSQNTNLNNPSLAGPPPSGPPPLTSYNRPIVNRHPSSRYPSSTFLQTVPSAQYYTQSNPNTPSVSPSSSLQNFPKANSSSPVTFLVPPASQAPQQPSTIQTSSSFSELPSVPPLPKFPPVPTLPVCPPVPPHLIPPLQICPPAPKDYIAPNFNLPNSVNNSLTASTPQLSQSHSPSTLQASHPSVLTPVNISPCIPQLSQIPIVPNHNTVLHPPISVPSLPVSQPVIIPTTSGLLPSNSVKALTSQPTCTTFADKSTPLTSIPQQSTIKPPNSIYQPSHTLSTALPGASSSLQSTTSNTSFPSLSSFVPAFLGSSESSVSPFINIATQITTPPTCLPPSLSQATSPDHLNSSPPSKSNVTPLSNPQTLPAVSSESFVPQLSLHSTVPSSLPQINPVKPIPVGTSSPISTISNSTVSVFSSQSNESNNPTLIQPIPPVSNFHLFSPTDSIPATDNKQSSTNPSGIKSSDSLFTPPASLFPPSLPTSVTTATASSTQTFIQPSSGLSRHSPHNLPPSKLIDNFAYIGPVLSTGSYNISGPQGNTPPQKPTLDNTCVPRLSPVSTSAVPQGNTPPQKSTLDNTCVPRLSPLSTSTGPQGSTTPQKSTLDNTCVSPLQPVSTSTGPQSSTLPHISKLDNTCVPPFHPVSTSNSLSNTQTSVSEIQPQPSLFTFATPPSSTDFTESLQNPPIISPTNLHSTVSDHSHPKPEIPPTTQPQFLPTFSLFTTQNPTVDTSLPPIDTSKILSTFPASINQIENPSIQSLPVTNNSETREPGFTPFPSRKFNSSTPSTLKNLAQPPPPPPQSINSNKNISTSSHPNTSTLVSSAPPYPSLTPPPPYSSLSFTSNTGQSQIQQKESIPSVISLTQPDGITDSSQNFGGIKEEELDQVPLDGNTVPLYNPLSLGVLPHHSSSSVPLKGGGPSNTYRLGSGLKRPSYAPVPDLGISHQSPQVFTTMSNTTSLHNMATSTVNTTTSIATVTTPSTTPSSSVTSSPPPESNSFNYSVTAQGQIYRPAYHHWFYKKDRETKALWQPFSMADSLNLEQVFTSPDLNETTKVPTDGGRYDVEVVHRRKIAVYWEEPPGEVRRCSWFVRAPIESRYIPYDENIAEILEDAYKTGCLRNEWNRRVELADGEVIILHSPNAIAHHQRSSSPDAWGNPPTMQQKPRIVKRGLEDFEISEGEPNQIDHLLLMVHGIGKVCDLRFRSLVQVVDDFRSVSLQLIQSHFRTGIENGNVGRVEMLPVEWHRALHTETIDKRLADITLPSIPKAREFTNDVLLDILFYTSPVFCERIVQAVGAEINRVYNLYMSRNPGFRGGVSLGGHSLGSLILFDMLCHQKPHRSMKSAFSPQSSIQEGDEDIPEFGGLKAKARLSRRMSYLTIGTAGTGQPYINYPQLYFQPNAFFAIGSPIGMFLTVRGIEGLGEDFKFPTCPKFLNIFHPNDPVAYRIEALVSTQMVGVPAVVIPHHKGRKRMHLELKDTMAHVTAALKQKLIDSMRSTWNTVYQLAMFHRPDGSIQQEVDKVLENEILTSAECETATNDELMMSDQEALDVKVGKLNGGNRIDYVLQEAPLETFNQYISAVRSHVVYWESEDTMLLILKEIYATIGISPDCQVPQPILPFDISSDTGNDTYSEYTDSIGAPPTQFVRK